MILVDTCVWIDHLHAGEARLMGHLEKGAIVSHPMVVTEVALGSLKHRGPALQALDRLRSLPQVRGQEVRTLVDKERLWGSGIGLVDAHLLASVLITPGARLWTRDRRLADAAHRLGVATPTW